jgi:hypothetical protein
LHSNDAAALPVAPNLKTSELWFEGFDPEIAFAKAIEPLLLVEDLSLLGPYSLTIRHFSGPYSLTSRHFSGPFASILGPLTTRRTSLEKVAAYSCAATPLNFLVRRSSVL